VSRSSLAGTARDAPTVVSVRSVEGIVVAAIVDVLSLKAAGQVDVLHEHVARVGALTLTRV
jgi:hypothetical protein